MAETFEIEAQTRTEHGKAVSRRLRRLENKIPGVVYGADKDPVSLTLDHNKVIKALENEAFYSQILSLKVDGKAEKVVLRDLQRHPYKPKVLHMDFQRISMKDKITMQVPLHFMGEDVAPGVKQGGGIISHLETSVEISCLPADLPEFIEVDVSKLELDNSIHLSDIKAGKGVEFVALSHENDLPVVSIHLPRAAKEEEAAVEEPPETEVITEKAAKEDEGEEKSES